MKTYYGFAIKNNVINESEIYKLICLRYSAPYQQPTPVSIYSYFVVDLVAMIVSSKNR
jgi:hypothetical protein